MHFTTGTERSVVIPSEDVLLNGNLVVPAHCRGIVIFAHGSGSSRFSPRNRYVAKQLNRASIATLLFDSLTEREESIDLVTAELRFDIALLARRLSCAADWLRAHARTRHLPLGYFGASTGAAAALVSAAARSDVAAIVSRGGRPDLAGPSLEQVRAAVLLIVGGEDSAVIDLNRAALQSLGGGTKRIEIIEGATHLFEEPGALEQVARLAGDFFASHLR